MLWCQVVIFERERRVAGDDDAMAIFMMVAAVTLVGVVSKS